MITIISIAAGALLVVASTLLALRIKESDQSTPFMKAVAWSGVSLGIVLIIVSVCTGIFMGMHRYHRYHARHGERCGMEQCDSYSGKHGVHHGMQGKGNCSNGGGMCTGGNKPGGGMHKGGGMNMHMRRKGMNGERVLEKEIIIIDGDTLKDELTETE